MALAFSKRILRACGVAVLLFALTGLAAAPGVLAQNDTPPAAQTFPGFNEVVPHATALAAKLTEATAQIQQLEDRKKLYETLDALQEKLANLEQDYQDWQDVGNWQINRLLRAQASYMDLAEQQALNLGIINDQLQTLENLRVTWQQEKSYWQQWREHLQQTGVKVPQETFNRALKSIDEFLQRVARVSNELVKSQQKYAPTQEVLTERLSTISRTMESLRKDTLRRNAVKMFEADYYQQFDHELLSRVLDSLATSMSLPDNTLQRHGDVIALYLLSIIAITLLFIYRNRRGEPLSKEWVFLFRRPLAGATFISIVVIGIFTELDTSLPLLWKWLLFMAITIAAMRLLNAFFVSPGVKKTIRIIAGVFILTESLAYFGLPTPLMQLYNVFICALAIPVCWRMVRKPGEEMAKHRLWFYLILGVALVGLVASVLGYESLTSNLISSTLTTFIVLLLVKMALHLSNQGIETLLQMEWIRNRRFMQVLGVEAGAGKLKMLVKLIILANTAIYLLVTWHFFEDPPSASKAILDFEYSIGEFNVSIKMIVMVVVVLYLTTIVSWVIQAFVDSQIMAPRKMDVGVKESLKRLTHYGLFTVGFLIAMSMAGLGMQNLSIIVGALGVGIGFGLQNIVNNFVSGLILLFERPIKVGDVINIDQDWGTITKIGLRSTIFETFDRSEIIVPNADLIAQKVTNWTFSSKIVRVVLPVGVAYGSPLEKVLEILTRAARENPDVLSYPAANAIFTGFGDSSIDFELRVWISTIDDRLKVYSELGVAIDRLFREEGIEIPFPQRDLHLRSIDSNLQTLFATKTAHGESEGTPE